MKFDRVLSEAPHGDVAELVLWKRVDCKVTDQKTGEVIFHQEDVEVPQEWSQHAANILAQKYFRKAGVPKFTVYAKPRDLSLPEGLKPHRRAKGCELGGETSARQVFHRMAGAWTYHGWISGLITDETQARIFYDECYLCLAYQYAAPNSPQWFNTGLWWAYGISGPDSGMWICDDGTPQRVSDSYSRPQPHACFLTSIEDDLVNEGGIMDAWVREARIFKHGSGSGMNISDLRAKGESLSAGGKSSGVMSWLRIGDSAAGAIQSGGTTRRAAVMRIMNIDHPEIESFINWKVREESKAAALFVGSREIADGLSDTQRGDEILPRAVRDRLRAGFDQEVFGVGWEEEANRTIDGQNSNNSVRVTNAFMEQATAQPDTTWPLTARTTGEVVKTVLAGGLWDQITRAAWACADPGLLFHDTINEWNTCSADGEITTTNPCAEFHFLTSNACNLASLKLTAFRKQDGSIDLKRYVHVVRLFTTVLDISVSMASFPDHRFAQATYNYRTLGLGYADLGGLLMRMAIPYDSDEGRALAAALTALMTGVAYRTSAEMAEEIGPFPRWEANQVSFRAVMQKHREAMRNIQCINQVGAIADLAREYWDFVQMSAKSFRNAQATLVAPTGTIAFVLDCDTTGMECEFALRKFKHLAGGGSMASINQAMPEGLRKLGYSEDAITSAIQNIETTGGFGGFYWSDPIHEAVFDCSNPAPGSTRCLRWQAHVEMLAAIQPHLSGAASKTINLPNTATVDDVSDAYVLCWKRGVKAVALFRDGCKLSQPMQTTPIERNELSGFHPMWKPSIERIKSKPGENLSGEDLVTFSETDPTKVAQIRAGSRLDLSFASPPGNSDISFMNRGIKEHLPWRRRGGYAQKAKIGPNGQSLFWRVSEYPDGRPGEIFIVLAGEGSTMRAFAECLAIQMSVSLQHGTPVSEVADKFLHVKFEPSGFVEGHEHVKFASSIADLIAKDLLIEYCGRKDLSILHEHEAIGDPEKVVALDRGAIAAVSGQASGEPCPRCNEELRRDGRCRQCPNCGWNEGCSG